MSGDSVLDRPCYTGVNMNTRRRNMNKSTQQNYYDRRYKDKQKESGIKQMRVMVPERDVEKVKAYAAKLRMKWKLDQAEQSDK